MTNPIKYVMCRTRDGVPIHADEDLGSRPKSAIGQFMNVHDSLLSTPSIKHLELSKPCEGQPPWAYAMAFVWEGQRWEYWIDERCRVPIYLVRWL